MRDTIIAIVLILITMPVFTNATHIMGGFMCYENLGYDSTQNGYIYKFKLDIYRDMGGVALPASLNVTIFNDDPPTYTQLAVIALTAVARDTIYPADFLGPNCNLTLNYTVVTEIVHYERNLLVGVSLTGRYIVFGTCCRNPTIDNLIPNEGITFWSYIPPTFYENSSPCFDDLPTLYACKNTNWTVSNRATDPDGDLLFYELRRPYDFNQTPPITDTVLYVSPFYDELHPFGQTSTYTIAPNGISTVNADSIGVYVVSVEVKEFRNGNYLSSSVRDIPVSVETCPGDDPAELDTSGLSPQITYSGGSNILLNLAEGDSTCVLMPFYDPDGDAIWVNYSGDIFNNNPPATMTLIPNGDSSQVIARFCWNAVCGEDYSTPKIVNLEVVNVGACPISLAYFTMVINVNSIPFSVSSDTTICEGDTIQLSASGGDTYIWYPNVDINNTSVADPLVWPSSWMIYTVEIHQSNGCVKSKDVEVLVTNSPPANMFVSSTTLIVNLGTGLGYGYQWYFNGGALQGDTLQTIIATMTGNYWVVVSDTTGCSTESEHFHISMDAVEEISQHGISLVPNPSTGMIDVRGILTSAPKIFIYNIQGELVQFERALRFELNIDEAGIYLVEIQDGARLYHQKLVLHR